MMKCVHMRAQSHHFIQLSIKLQIILQTVHISLSLGLLPMVGHSQPTLTAKVSNPAT